MHTEASYDVAIVGGGLAGLSAAIQLRKYGYRVIVFEKEGYPFHKVCGEYLSMENMAYLKSAGMDLLSLNLPRIKRLQLSAVSGRSLTTELPLGGVGMSRFKMDELLASLARDSGVHVLERTKVHDVQKGNVLFQSFDSGHQLVSAEVVCGAFGKKSNIDVKWNRRSGVQKHNNFVAVKYHVHTEWPDDLIGLHQFAGGYCGISKIEDEKFCLCYMVSAERLNRAGNSIEQLQQKVLSENPFLKEIFSSVEVLDEFPVIISQIHFQRKKTFEHDTLMIGDAAGMIVPLAGNGMSIALHSGKMAADLIRLHLENKMSLKVLSATYEKEWKQHFGRRFAVSRLLQSAFGNAQLADLIIRVLHLFPSLAPYIIRLTHGKSY